MFSRNATIEGMRRSSNACAMAARSRMNIGPRRQDDRLAAGVVHGAERAGIALFAFDFNHARLEAKLARRCRGCVALLARNRVVCDAKDGRTRERLARDLDAFGGELELARENAGHVAPGAREVRHIALGERVEIDGEKHDRLSVGGRNRRAQRALVSDREEYVDLARRELAIAVFVAFEIRGLDVVERNVAAFLISEFGHPPAEVVIERGLAGLHADKADAQHRLLRAPRERPHRHTAESQEELAPPHSITSSARDATPAGTS